MPETLGTVLVNARSRPIEIDRRRRQFEIAVDDDLAFLAFDARPSVLSLLHTETPPALRGHGLGDALVRAALDYARSHRMTVEPFCPFVAAYIRSHPEYSDLVAPSFHL